MVVAVVVALAAAPAAMGRRTATYTSPGYKPARIPKNFVPAKPPPPVVLQPSGNTPHVFVDGAGSAHVVFAEPSGAGADTIRTCRLLRGGKGCVAGATLTPNQPAAGNDPQTNQDFDGPFPLAVGNELLVLDSRCCNRVPITGGSITETPVYLYTSEDAGATFTGPTDANPGAGVIGTQDPSGDAIVYGGDVPSIGLISSVQTGGTVFQGVPAGSFTTDTANLSLRPDKQDASNGRLGLDGTRPIAAFSDFSGTITVREWTGNGSVNDAAQWTTLRVAGADQPRIAGGPRGIALLTEPSTANGALSVRSIASGGGSAGPPQLLTTKPARSPTLSADPVSGMFAAAWIDGADESVHVRTSPDGRAWGPDQLVMRVPGGDLGELDVAATADGGGFVALRDAKDAPTVYNGRILAGQFGPIGPTGHPGLGLAAGGSGPPSGDQAGFVACSQIHFGTVDIQATAGCFLRDPKHPSSGAGVAESAINLNGLQIVPDAGARIFIDPHAHTIDTQGAVSVIAEGAGSNPVTLWHGPLHVAVPAGATDGATLFDLPMDKFAANVEGFGISAHAVVILTSDGVRIPVDLKMPDYFGGITGHADLVVDTKSGLHLDTLNFAIADVDIGAVELKDANVQYMSNGDTWDGGAQLIVPGPGVTVGAELHFARGSFNGGDFKVAEFPGIPVFSDVFLNEIRIGFQLDPIVFTGGVTFGFQPIAPPNSYAIGVRGDFRIETGPPVVVQIVGSGSVFGVDLAHAFFRYSSDGTLRILADVTIGSPPGLGISGALKFGIIGKAFGGSIDANACAFGFCDRVAVAANQRGLAVCLGAPGSISHDWDDAFYSIKVHFLDCVADQYGAPAGTRAVPRAGGGPPGQTFTVPAGASSYTVAVAGAGGAPQVSLLDPAGAVVPFGDPKARGTVAATIPGVPQSNTTFVGLAHPKAGTYTLVPAAASPAIAALQVSRGYATPKVSARLGGTGRKRTLRYQVSNSAPGTTIVFVERGPAGDVPIGTAKGAAGTLRFTSGNGPGGSRQILAQATRGGLPYVSPEVAHYIAPAIPRPGSVGRLRVARTGGGLSIRFAGARGAKSYTVKVLLSDGRGLLRTVKAPKHGLTIPKVKKGVRAKVTVTPVGADGRRGTVGRAVVH
ncbi:hypothetical protein NBH00_03710 [Paraconexibacter antarcticus]|uniref:Uncharacterized protein n=1 Tax=Paraconexibacter antarcticus TaxID=2949664 RepID=A0ABY5DXB2_9ACTN|nr:hypothetical protein [Paraconexibacter antarcticus]UTI65322.1 hypothetical protein NBH00_03710 [Paraconexibacter antarcticus]